MCMIADMLGDKGSVTGVDVAEARLGACRNVLAKYQIYNSRLFLQDGTAFSCLAPAQVHLLISLAAFVVKMCGQYLNTK